MLVLIGALLASMIFPLATYFFLRNAHKENPDYRKDCRKLLLSGLLLCIPVFGFSLLCDLVFVFLGLRSKYPFLKPVFEAFVLMAFSEELMKYLLAGKIIKKNHSAVSFLDVMSYTTIAAIGFEIMESVVYVASANVAQILVRGITNMHAAFGLIMGYILAKGYKKNGKAPVVQAVLASTLIHGIYDFCLSEEIIETDWGYISLLLAALCLVLVVYNFFFMTKARKKSYYTDPLFPEQEETTLEG